MIHKMTWMGFFHSKRLLKSNKQKKKSQEEEEERRRYISFLISTSAFKARYSWFKSCMLEYWLLLVADATGHRDP